MRIANAPLERDESNPIDDEVHEGVMFEKKEDNHPCCRSRLDLPT